MLLAFMIWHIWEAICSWAQDLPGQSFPSSCEASAAKPYAPEHKITTQAYIHLVCVMKTHLNNKPTPNRYSKNKKKTKVGRGCGGAKPPPPSSHNFNTYFYVVAASVLYIICLTSAEDVSPLYNSSTASQFKCIYFPYKCIAVLCEAIAVICNSIYFQHEDMAFLFKAIAFVM